MQDLAVKHLGKFEHALIVSNDNKSFCRIEYVVELEHWVAVILRCQSKVKAFFR